MTYSKLDNHGTDLNKSSVSTLDFAARKGEKQLRRFNSASLVTKTSLSQLKKRDNLKRRRKSVNCPDKVS